MTPQPRLRSGLFFWFDPLFATWHGRQTSGVTRFALAALGLIGGLASAGPRSPAFVFQGRGLFYVYPPFAICEGGQQVNVARSSSRRQIPTLMYRLAPSLTPKSAAGLSLAYCCNSAEPRTPPRPGWYWPGRRPLRRRATGTHSLPPPRQK